MTRSIPPRNTLHRLLRPLIPNFRLQIAHAEPGTFLNVRLRQHLGLIARGAKAYESQYVNLMRGLVSKGDIVFDVGANIGFYSVLFSRWVWSAGKVIAYEPDPRNVELLKRNLTSNGCQNVIVRDVALSKEQGSECFSLDRITGATGHLGAGPTYAETILGSGQSTLVKVTTSTLDAEATLWGPPNLIKLDIEGGELDALSGALTLLARRQVLIVSELSVWNESTVLSRAAEATLLLGDFGYVMIDLDTCREIKPGSVGWMILAVPRDRVRENVVAKAMSKFAYYSGKT